MKKIIIGLVLIMAVTGCSQSSENYTSEPPKQQVKQTSTAQKSDKELMIEEGRKLIDLVLDDKDATKRVLNENAKQYWTKNGSTDWSMAKYEYEKQSNSFEYFASLAGRSDFKGSINEEILIIALSDWGLDFNMVMYEYDKQIEAYNSVN